MKPTFIEVCAGSGGLSSGLIKAGFQPLLLCDNNKDCCETLKLNHRSVKVVCQNMEDLDLSKYRFKVDLFTGGVPCQSFSQAGIRKGLDDPRGKLMIKFGEMIDILEPKIWMIENVKGLLTHKSGETLKEIIFFLNKDEKYDVQYKVLNSAEFNTAQKRERVFIIGTLKKLNISFTFPEKCKTRKLLKDILIGVPDSPCSKYSDEKIRLFKMIPQGGCWVNLPEDLQKSYLGKSYFSSGGKRGILKRLDMNNVSLTLLCSPSQKQTERCHPLYERPLSIREYARIQSFDDSYEFYGSISSCYRQIGNAVPVELAKFIGISIKKALNM